MQGFPMEAVQEMLLSSLRDLLPSLRRFSDKQLLTKLGKEKFEDASGQVADFVELGAGKDISRNEYLALVSQGLKCLLSYLESIHTPITVNNIINCVHLMPQAVDSAFPSYAKAGLLRCIVSPSRLKEVKRVQLMEMAG